MDIHITNMTNKSWEVAYVIEKVRQLFSKHRVSKIAGGIWWRVEGCTTSNVMLVPKVDLYTVAIPPPRDRD